MSAVVAFVPDLMDRSKVAAAVPSAVVVRSLDRLAELAAPGTTIVVDLSRPGVSDAIPALVAAGARVVGFGSHVAREDLAAAAAQGCAVYARSAFFADIAAAVA